MSTRPLSLRKTQLDLLARACECGSPATIAYRTRDAVTRSGGTRLLALESDAIWLEWTQAADADIAPSPRGAQVLFEHGGERYAFTAHPQERSRRRFGSSPETSALKLSLPLNVERRERRTQSRIRLSDVQPVHATVTAILEKTAPLTCRVLNLSAGGLAAITRWETARQIKPGDVCWIEFGLPDGEGPLDFAVRLAHRRRTTDGTNAILGWAFCPGDDRATTLAQLERVRRFVANHSRTPVRKAAKRGGTRRATLKSDQQN